MSAKDELSVRDYFAARAMFKDTHTGMSDDGIAMAAYDMAAAMMRERERRRTIDMQCAQVGQYLAPITKNYPGTGA